MPTVITWFAPNDTPIVGGHTILRVVEYCETSVTLEIRQSADAEPACLLLAEDWSQIFESLEARYRGIAINDKCVPARRAAIQFRGTDKIHVRRHSLGGVPIDGAKRLGR